MQIRPFFCTSPGVSRPTASTAFSEKFVFAAILFIVGLAWVGLSQIAVWRWPGGEPHFFGPDGMLAPAEDITFEWRLAGRGPLPSTIPVRYVNVDSESTRVFGNFPWNRLIFAEALDGLFRHGKVKAVALDFVFSDAGISQSGQEGAAEGSLALGRAIRDFQSVVLAATYNLEGGSGRFPFLFEGIPSSDSEPELPAFPVAGPTWGRVGLINTVGEEARFLPAFARSGRHTYLTLAIQMALLRWGAPEEDIVVQDEALVVHTKSGKRTIPLVLGQLVEPNWFSAWHSDTNPRTGIADVLAYLELARNGTEAQKADAAEFFRPFEGTYVFIGPTDPLLKDVSRLPMNGALMVPRVSVHGNLLKTLDSGRFLVRLPVWANSVLILVLSLVGGAFCLVSARWTRPAALGAIAVFAVYALLAFCLFAAADILLPVVAGLGGLASGFLCASVLQLVVAQRQKRRIKELFGSYVSAAVVNEMIEKNLPPKTGGAEVEITAFFSDIVSFSPLSEELPAKELVDLMCEYLAEVTGAITDESGTLDKYVGDAVVAIFGAPLALPDHAAAACRAALGFQAAQARLRERWSADGSKWPERVRRMRSRVGLHSGTAIVGNIGSPLRFNYTMMGDTVNLGQRTEGAGSHYGAGTLVTGETFAAAAATDPELIFRPLDRVRVPGRSQPVELIELLGRGAGDRAAFAARIEAYTAARRIYLEGDWERARAAFQEAAAFEDDPAGKNPSGEMAARCVRFFGSTPVENLVFPLIK